MLACGGHHVVVTVIAVVCLGGCQLVMSKDFPFSTDDMLPIAEVMSRTARHWRNVERFFTKKFPKGEAVGETDVTGGVPG